MGFADPLGANPAASPAESAQDGSVQFIASNPREAGLAARLNDLFVQAANSGAADLHLETTASKHIVVRMRNRDGDLETIHTFEPHDTHLVLTKIRYRANLSVVDTRAPQDSRITQDVGGRLLSVRVSIVPTVHGATCVMRLLDPQNSGRPLQSLRMPERVERAFKRVTRSPEGLILTVGPTGSGKTTTLYTALGMRNEPSVKIVTAEDPVEYLMEGLQQVEVGANRGMSFSQALRAFLRQDPDIILVGEIRDYDTLSTALQAGQTGHLVLSTLHANNVFEALERMLEIGAKPQTLRSALRAIVAQRLVRLVCPQCKRAHRIEDPEALDILKGAGLTCEQEWVGAGCEACNHTGYSGRQAIYEMLLMDKSARLALSKSDLAGVREAAEKQRQFVPLLPAAVELVRQGWTNMSEVQRVVVDF
jgi:type II secretory ATPase GspE/PulE/Tfp pilus assembly ATPase PilB-like protein